MLVLPLEDSLRPQVAMGQLLKVEGHQSRQDAVDHGHNVGLLEVAVVDKDGGLGWAPALLAHGPPGLNFLPQCARQVLEEDLPLQRAQLGAALDGEYGGHCEAFVSLQQVLERLFFFLGCEMVALADRPL